MGQGTELLALKHSIATTIGEKEGMEVFENEIDEKNVGDQVKETEYNPNRITCRNAEILTSISSLYPALKLLDLRLFSQHLARIRFDPSLILNHIPVVKV